MNVKRHILIFLTVVIVGGVAGGIIYAVIHKTSSKSSNSKSANDNGSNNNDNGDSTSSGDNPKTTGNNGSAKPGTTFLTWDNKVVDLTIKPDSRFKKSFYGMNYGPVNATYPSCGNTLGDVIEDIKVLSQLTDRLRLYGMDCNMANYTLMAIELLNLDMTIVPTVWVDANETTYQRQYNDLFANLKQHGFKHIDGISVGNEVLLDLTVPADDLFKRIADVRQKARAIPGAPTKLPVFTSDIGANINDTVTTAIDVVFANVHPYFAGVSAQEGTDWTFQFFDDTDVPPAKKQNKQAVISEVGWPSNGDPNKGAVASLPNLQIFLSQFVCAANQKGYMYYYFETYDTPWKTKQYGVLEGSWGLFNPDRTMKSLTIPDCKPTAATFTGP